MAAAGERYDGPALYRAAEPGVCSGDRFWYGAEHPGDAVPYRQRHPGPGHGKHLVFQQWSGGTCVLGIPGADGSAFHDRPQDAGQYPDGHLPGSAGGPVLILGTADKPGGAKP